MDAGVKVQVFGDKWDELVCEHPENLINGDSLYSEECLYQIQNSKISLNVLPWFRRGPHDRIFNTMLNGAVCLTDSNPYLDEMLVDGLNCVKYSLENPDETAHRVISLLKDAEQLQKIADEGYKLACAHTWAARMREFSAWLER